jgi:hypothetical protein
MSILPNETYADLINDLYSKFPELQNGKGLEVRFEDEDGDMLNIGRMKEISRLLLMLPGESFFFSVSSFCSHLS